MFGPKFSGVSYCICRQLIVRKKKIIDNLRKLSSSSSSSSQHLGQHIEEKTAALYVHWPYCARRCTYCNFNKYISSKVDHDRMATCLTKELDTLLNISGVSRITSVFFGGGTPSLARPSTIQQVMEMVQRRTEFSEGSEVTLEANPAGLDTGLLQEFKDAGINRLSIGIQSLNDDDLKVLGRDHSVPEAVRCIERSREVFPARVSVDVIFGRPGQTLDMWTRELDQVLAICDNHVSLYQLTIERGTQLYKWVEKGIVTLPDEDAMADMYITAIQMLESHGLDRYEVSNFARKGFESKHNQAYWTGQQYIGIGPGAHGRFSKVDSSGVREARVQTLEPDNWMWEVERHGHATRLARPLSQVDRCEELLCLGLRTREGVSHQSWKSLSPDLNLESLLTSTIRTQELTEHGHIILDHRGVRATTAGLLVLDSILPYLLLALSQSYETQAATVT